MEGEPWEASPWWEGGEECDTDVVASLDVEGDPGKGRGGIGVDMEAGEGREGKKRAKTDPSQRRKRRWMLRGQRKEGKELDLSATPKTLSSLRTQFSLLFSQSFSDRLQT